MNNSEAFHQLPIAEVPKHVRAELADFLKEREPQIAQIGRPVTNAIEHLERFILGGGKRIRPLYVWAGFVAADGLLGDEDPQAVLRAASSLEFIQSCALIHDDIVDASDTRRGNPTVHRAVEAEHRKLGWTGDPEAFGRSAAILIGDMSLVWAEDMLLDSGLSQAALQRTREPWRAMRTEVIGGQLLDVSLEAAAIESVELSDSVNRFKTAAYTIERPLHLGAAIAGAPQKLIDAFRGYGRDIGIAFQLRDDQLGVFGDPKVTGKPAGDDLREGKRTVLMAIALQRADEQDPSAAQFLRDNLGATDDPSVLSKMAQMIEDSGAPEEIEQRIDALTQSGLEYLAAAQVNSEVTELLRSLAIQSTARAK
ncbi:polyprenyl synthetase family protein [Corynebacterium ammoniagenes]|uniref:Geranylgeranyl pyrophosphate synthase n=2 Tax=Corynebacterium ammoniagenes TaxID=1697 RepID=A0AAV5G1Q9_CORAM|nr:polyprenyl synthetase family protein [Corynebacterium ammoniagenes]APT82290.1 geranylgeranyl pyrophosphate synthase [Corynebacterium ammoniagenes DSM 20306]AQS73381.1 geranylgeranyl pyrophosphate synthase [Corynebacterium ammoniagenes]EFG82496.1 polyprenyl synthetase [Corynebacterium ammoniagenes DSM 20306]GJN42118.1 geranylgeranyl pyrophosphate synthase [Corynebacterium ammoniagenes]